ncbi:MAG: hypothetical protein ACKVOQ_10390 [Cyclobacteriaceae bacterium]
MKRVFIIFALINLSLRTFAQEDVAEIDLPSVNLKDTQIKSLGDSLFIAVDWFDSNSDLVLKKGYWVDSRGTISSYEFGFLQKAILCGVEKTNEGVYYYYLDLSQSKKDRDEIRVMRSNGESKQILKIKQSIHFEGDFLGIVNSNGIKAITYNGKDQNIRITGLEKGEIMEDNQIHIPSEFEVYLRESFTLFEPESINFIGKGSTENKLFYTKDKLTIVANNFSTKTIAITIDLSAKKVLSFQIPSNTYKKASYFHNGLLYYLSASSKEYSLRIFDLTSNNELYKKEYPRLDAFKDNQIYWRIDKMNKDKLVFKGESLYKLMNSKTDFKLSILVESDHENKPIIVFGDFFDEKGGGIAGGSNLLTMMAVFLVTTTLRESLGNGAGQSRYSYLSGDITAGFKINTEFKENKPLRQVIDDYEIAEQSKKSQFDSKNYIMLQSKKIIAIYHFRSEKKIKFVKF